MEMAVVDWASMGSNSSSSADRSPTRRKFRSKSGAGSKPKDPLLELMMNTLLERQRAESESGGAAAGAKSQQVHVMLHQPSEPSAPGPQPPACSSTAAGGNRCCWSLWQKLWFRVAVVAALIVAIALAVAIPVGLQKPAAAKKRPMQPPQQGLGPRLDTSGMALVFNEDFTFLDTATWNTELGDGSDYGLDSWGNKELQCYTSSPNNIDVIPHPDYPDADGALRIRPVYSPTPVTCVNKRSPDSTRQWTSAKVDTKNKVAFTWAGQQVYSGAVTGARSSSGGRKRELLEAPASSSNLTCGSVVVESRMKFPMAAGRWSALWMMPQPQLCPGQQQGECGAFGGWPRSGEIDIVEQVNNDSQVISTVHYADTFGVHRWLGSSLDMPRVALEEWSIYQVLWNCTAITWYINTQQVHQVLRSQLGSATWPFDEPFFLIINTAVGGLLTGNAKPDVSASAPFLVDYVRVYAAQSS